MGICQPVQYYDILIVDIVIWLVVYTPPEKYESQIGSSSQL
jgi:hypothetical protein